MGQRRQVAAAMRVDIDATTRVAPRHVAPLTSRTRVAWRPRCATSYAPRRRRVVQRASWRENWHLDASSTDAHHIAMERTRTNATTHDDVARYDPSLARDIARRDVNANVGQRERDARRADYDAAMTSMPLTLALRAIRVPTSPTSQNAWRHTPRTYVETPPTLGAKGRPQPNAWEAQDDHARTHLRPDRECHHPLVKCHHKW